MSPFAIKLDQGGPAFRKEAGRESADSGIGDSALPYNPVTPSFMAWRTKSCSPALRDFCFISLLSRAMRSLDPPAVGPCGVGPGLSLAVTTRISSVRSDQPAALRDAHTHRDLCREYKGALTKQGQRSEPFNADVHCRCESNIVKRKNRDLGITRALRLHDAGVGGTTGNTDRQGVGIDRDVTGGTQGPQRGIRIRVQWIRGCGPNTQDQSGK